MRFFGFRARPERDDDLDEEIRAHFEMAVRDRIARGESPDAARDAARREFGNVSHVKEVTREMWGGASLERLALDLRYALRSLRRTPSFTAVAVLTLALGIGANTAMFTVMNGVLVRSLPFPEPERLVAPSYKLPPSVFSPNPGLYDRHYVAYEHDTTVFSSMATYSSPSLTLTEAGDPLKVKTTIATSGFFSVLRVSPSIGRVFTPASREDDVVILSDALWRERFAADRRVVGGSIMLEGKRRTVIGVMPASFDFPAGTGAWTPFTVAPEPGNIMLRSTVARLKPGLTREQALRAFAARASEFDLPPGFNRTDFTPDVVPLKEVLIGDARRPLFIFAGALVFVLLIACANVANLLLMRVTSRDREIAVRGALGAGRWRLVCQLLTETLALTAIGAAIGIPLAIAAVRVLIAVAPAGTIPRAADVHLDAAALAFTAGLSLITAVLCGLVPALHATEERLRISLSAGSRTIAGTHARLRSLLVVGEIALALVLLIGAGLLLRSFERMQAVNLGFEPTNVVAATVDLPPTSYRTVAQIHAFERQVLANLRAIPGVDAAGAVNWAPLDNMLVSGDFYLENGRKVKGATFADKMSVSPGYFRAMGLRVIGGRDFTDTDRADAPGVVVISRVIADKLWPNGDAIGQRVTMNEKPPQTWLTVVGVVGDVVQSDVKNAAGPAMYLPIEQTNSRFFISHLTFAARHSSTTAAIAPAVRQIVRDADKNLAVGVVSTMSERISATTRQPRFQSRVLLTFSIVALLLAVIGIYGVLAYGVSQRQHEIGVRIALGANAGEVVQMIVRRTLLLAVPGVLIGLGAAMAVTRVLGKFLFQVTPTDPLTFTTVAALLTIVALAAALVPARRASRVDPMTALRSE